MARDVQQTRSGLLRAARAEFAEYGLAGARVDRIAASAGVNKERIYGHFGNKDGLFDAVLAQTMVDAAADKPLQPGDGPAGYAGRTFDFHRAQPDLLRLLMWEALSRPVDSALGDAERQAHYDRKVDGFVAAGLSESDARHALLVVLALTTYAAALPQVAALVLGRDHTQAELRRRIVETVETLVASLATGPR